MSERSIPGIRATQIAAPPEWAVVQRQLISTIESTTDLFVENFQDAAGNEHFVHDVDDVYESRRGRALLYALGGDERLLNMALREWNAATRFYSEEINQKAGEPIHPMFMPQLHNEWWNFAVAFNNDWFHMGEGSGSFYEFGLADPTIEENIRRSEKFAAMYTGEDPQAPNYDPEHRVFRSGFTSSQGPLLTMRGISPLIHSTGAVTGELEMVRSFLDPGSLGDFGHRRGSDQGPSKEPLFTHLYPVVERLEGNWFENPERRDEIMGLFDRIILNGDEPANLLATGLVTNAYLYTGDEKYKKWVLDYVGAWMERTEKNGGILPDNVGPTGQIGENRNGLWWNGVQGWNRRGGWDRMMFAVTVGAECALLLSGDHGYLEFPRSQLKLILDQATRREDGHLQVPNRYGPDGWAEPRSMGLQELNHLYHASMSPQDRELIYMLRDGDRETDWNEVAPRGDGKGGSADHSRFNYYDGRNDDWPAQMMRADLEWALRTMDCIRLDSRDVAEKLRDNYWPVNTVPLKGLVHLTTGAPMAQYNGGMQLGRVRFFDTQRARSGLPLDVAALVDDLQDDRAGIQLVNLNATEGRSLIMQAGTHGEHAFTEATYNEESYPKHDNPSMWPRAERSQDTKTVAINGRHLEVELPPSTMVRIDAGMQRFVNDPSYAFPWHE